MVRKIILLGAVFVVVFFLTTAISDFVCHVTGYYQVGIQEERELEQWQQ
jgi:hypothetical protein